MAALRDIVGRVWRRKAGDPTPVRPENSGLFPADPAAPIVLVTAFGIAATDLDTTLDRVLDGQPANCRVICLTDQPDFAPLRRRGVAFEYLPPPKARSSGLADARSWHAYVTERYDILIAKWRPDHVIAAGTSLEQFLA